MLLCDIGNTNVKFYHNRKVWSISIDEFNDFKTKEKVYYINVNESMSRPLSLKENFTDLEKYFHFDTIYEGMGIDRISACYTIEDGLVVDAGSAITVDIMAHGIHLGGFILPGINESLQSYKNISPRLDVTLNTKVDILALPQKTSTAISYGIIKPIVSLIEENAKDKKIYFAGGDGAFLSRFFPNSIYRKNIVFDGMLKAIRENNLYPKDNEC